MNYPYNSIFGIPDRILLNKRLTKVFFQRNFTLLASEKKLINNTILGMEWFASVKPKNANIPAVRNSEYVYEEIQLMICTIAENKLDSDGKKCIELFQKYIPYQMIVIVEDEHEFIINTCDKRINQNDNTKRTIVNYFTTPVISKLYKNAVVESFSNALNFSNLDKTNLETVYRDYKQAVIQFQAATITGTYQKRNETRTKEDLENLLAIEKLENEIDNLKSQLAKEKQLNIQVNLNMEIQKKKEVISNIKDKLNHI